MNINACSSVRSSSVIFRSDFAVNLARLPKLSSNKRPFAERAHPFLLMTVILIPSSRRQTTHIHSIFNEVSPATSTYTTAAIASSEQRHQRLSSSSEARCSRQVLLHHCAWPVEAPGLSLRLSPLVRRQQGQRHGQDRLALWLFRQRGAAAARIPPLRPRQSNLGLAHQDTSHPHPHVHPNNHSNSLRRTHSKASLVARRTHRKGIRQHLPLPTKKMDHRQQHPMRIHGRRRSASLLTVRSVGGGTSY